MDINNLTAAALRRAADVSRTTANFTWQTDPFEFYDNSGTKLARSLMNASDANGDPHVVGRDPQVYQQLTSEVRRWYLESKLANNR